MVLETRRTTRVWIPHPKEDGVNLAGDLEHGGQVNLPVGEITNKNSKGIVLILHGTMGHKDYLYQKKLAKTLAELHVDSFRFDFRGNHESGGKWEMAKIPNDVDDIQTVADYLSKHYGYTITTIVGHSRGSIAGFRWMCTSMDAAKVRGYVNVSGRYRMEANLDPIYKPHFESQGYYEWKLTVARKPRVSIIRPEDLDDFASFDTSLVWDKFPQHVHALTVHGLKDATVPPYDAVIYARALGARHPGTHNLHYIEDGDHNFSNHTSEVVETIVHWYKKLDEGSLTTGVWNAGVKGKL